MFVLNGQGLPQVGGKLTTPARPQRPQMRQSTGQVALRLYGQCVTTSSSADALEHNNVH
jgi:hypothetical protein